MTLFFFAKKKRGEMAEWFMAPVLKTGIVSKNYRGFESLSLLFCFSQILFHKKTLNFREMTRLKKKPSHFQILITNFFNY